MIEHAAPHLQVIDLVAGYVRGLPVVHGVSIEVDRGEIVTLIGPNGAGKSTLYNLISGRFPLTSGAIRLKGEDVTNLSPYEINRKGLSRSFQVTNLFNNLSVYENLRCADQAEEDARQRRAEQQRRPLRRLRERVRLRDRRLVLPEQLGHDHPLRREVRRRQRPEQ